MPPTSLPPNTSGLRSRAASASGAVDADKKPATGSTQGAGAPAHAAPEPQATLPGVLARSKSAAARFQRQMAQNLPAPSASTMASVSGTVLGGAAAVAAQIPVTVVDLVANAPLVAIGAKTLGQAFSEAGGKLELRALEAGIAGVGLGYKASLYPEANQFLQALNQQAYDAVNAALFPPPDPAVAYVEKISANLQANPELALPAHVLQAQAARKEKEVASEPLAQPDAVQAPLPAGMARSGSSSSINSMQAHLGDRVPRHNTVPGLPQQNRMLATKQLIAQEARGQHSVLSGAPSGEYASLLKTWVSSMAATQEGVPLNREALTSCALEAASKGHVEALSALIALDPNLVNAHSPSGFTPLMAAAVAAHSNDAVVGLLIDAGAYLNDNTADGLNALMCAATHPSPKMLKMLLDAGADIHAKKDDGVTALFCAQALGQPESVVLLQEALARRVVREQPVAAS
jgi:hypothetical protein